MRSWIKAIVGISATTAWVAFPQELLETKPYSNVITNDVCVSENGMRMALSDETNIDSVVTLLTDTEIDANREVNWVLHKGSQSIAFLGMSNSFVFSLRTPNGALISKTPKGEGMSGGPRSLTNPYVNNFHRLSTGIRNFPKLDELFLFPSNGTYILDLAYRDWSAIQGKFVLSRPVVLRVVKQGMSTNGPAVNAASHSVLDIPQTPSSDDAGQKNAKRGFVASKKIGVSVLLGIGIFLLAIFFWAKARKA